MFGFERIVVAYHAAGLWAEFVRRRRELCNEGKLWATSHHVENIRVMVETVQSIRGAYEYVGEDR